MKEIPKGPTGKIQRIALAEQLGSFDRGGQLESNPTEHVAPRNRLEQRLAEVWAGIVSAERVGVHDSFAYLGGDSLLAANLFSQVSAIFDVAPKYLAFDEVPTIAEMAQRLRQVLPENSPCLAD